MNRFSASVCPMNELARPQSQCEGPSISKQRAVIKFFRWDFLIPGRSQDRPPHSALRMGTLKSHTEPVCVCVCASGQGAYS
jgi:hypothetical protein